MAKDPLDELPPEEQGLRRELRACAGEGRWEDFGRARLILADWLADRGREREAVLTRAPWRKVRGGEKIQVWALKLVDPVDWLRAPTRLQMLQDTTNSGWVLHFAPESLKYQGLPPLPRPA